MKNVSTILHPTDFSQNAQHALKVACDLARNCEARLIVLHVAPPLPAAWTKPSRALPDCYTRLWDDEAPLHSVGCREVLPERMLRAGEPALVIVDVANEINADLIVIGQPRPSRWRWLVEERVAQVVTRTAPCPVLIAGPPKPRPLPVQKASGKSLRGRAIAMERSASSRYQRLSERSALTH
jgi:nucleotide-binding universal stress UspA family protein